MYLKTYEIDGEKLIALCDESLIGRSLEDGDLCLNISEQFYKGEVVTDEEAILSLSGATNVNLVGEKAIKCAIDAGMLDKENVIRISGVPHAQICVI